MAVTPRPFGKLFRIPDLNCRFRFRRANSFICVPTGGGGVVHTVDSDNEKFLLDRIRQRAPNVFPGSPLYALNFGHCTAFYETASPTKINHGRAADHLYRCVTDGSRRRRRRRVHCAFLCARARTHRTPRGYAQHSFRHALSVSTYTKGPNSSNTLRP